MNPDNHQAEFSAGVEANGGSPSSPRLHIADYFESRATVEAVTKILGAANASTSCTLNAAECGAVVTELLNLTRLSSQLATLAYTRVEERRGNSPSTAISG